MRPTAVLAVAALMLVASSSAAAAQTTTTSMAPDPLEPALRDIEDAVTALEDAVDDAAADITDAIADAEADIEAVAASAATTSGRALVAVELAGLLVALAAGWWARDVFRRRGGVP